jgi:hypothetical protein
MFTLHFYKDSFKNMLSASDNVSHKAELKQKGWQH